MANTSYDVLYENLLPKFRDYEIPLMTTEEVKEYLHDYVRTAIVKFHICKKDLSHRNEVDFGVELNDNEIEILSNFMLIAYVDANYVMTPTLLSVSLPSTDFHAFSPANFLDKLLAMRKDLTLENETLLSRYAWSGDLSSFKLGKKIVRE